MKIVQINATCGSGSTGKICYAISELLNESGIENYILYSNGFSDYEKAIKYSFSHNEIKLQALKSRLFGNYGFNSKAMTKRLINKLDEISPTIVHLHNLHSHNCDLELLLSYLKRKNIKLVWTFHDCWTFTAYCPHYDMIGCDKWQTMCDNCPQRKKYSWIFDRSSELYNKKKNAVDQLNLHIVTPSHWLAEQVKKSIFYDYPVTVIHNGIDLNVFKPASGGFREKYHCENKKIVLGVAYDWDNKKGLDVFLEMSRALPKDYQIVLVGTNSDIDKILPENVISIHRTQNQYELANIYTEADVFVNPTREEVLGLTNLEANACGTPVITFNSGGSPECIDDTCGIVVPKNDIKGIIDGVMGVCEKKMLSKEACISHAKLFDKDVLYQKYLKLYMCGE